MLLDLSHDPVIFLRTRQDASSSLEQQFETLLGRDDRFVLVTEHTEADHEGETAEERKQKALFFKQVRDRLRRLCLGMLIVEGGKPSTIAARLAAQAASKALGFPVDFAESEALALEQAERLLAA